METQAHVLQVPRSAKHRLVTAIDVIEALPLMRPRWVAFDIALILLFFVY
jgi:hypothetical protein